MTYLNEGFRPYRKHQCAIDAEPFIEAALVLETGGTIQQALAKLSAQHRTSLFHVEQRPPSAILFDAGKHGAAAILRACARELTGGAA